MRVLRSNEFSSSSPVTVLHVVEAIGAGVGRHVTDLIRHATTVRHEVAAGTERTGWDTYQDPLAMFEEAGAHVHRVEMRRTPHRPANVSALLKLNRLIRERRPAIVHGHSAIGGALGRLAGWQAPVVRIYTPHAVMPHRAATATERLLGRRTDHLVAVSESERDLIASLGLVPASRIHVVHNGIEPEYTPGTRDLRHELDIPAGAPLIASVARLEQQKAPEVFVAACERIARRLPDAHFLLIGSGPLEQRVAHDVDAGGLEDRFHLMAHVRDVSHLMEQFDVFVLTSRYEGLPYVVIEAMRAGLPVVATDVVGSRNAVVHGVTGVLVPPEDAAGIADAVHWMITAPQTAASFGRAGAARVRERFDVAHMAAELEDLYLRSAAALSSTRR